MAFAVSAAGPPARVYSIQTVAGSDFSGDGGPALAAILSQTEGIAIDNTGTIYVADADANRVRRITPDGIIQTVAGTGIAGFGGDGGPAKSALLNHPYGVALDSARNLYIADLGNARVRRVSADGTIQTVAGGGSIPPGANGDGSPATSAQLLQPRNVAVEPDGTLYISDFGASRVYRVYSNGTLTTLAGNGNAGFSGDGAAAALAQLKAPAGLAVDSNSAVYIADSGNSRIRKVYQGVITTVYSVLSPTGVAVTANGTLYVAAASYIGTQTRAIAGFTSARDLALDAAGNVYVTTGQFVRKATTDGKVTTLAGSGASPYFSGDNGLATSARLHTPSGIALDNAGNLYVADTANNRIRKITPGGVITTFAGTGEAGSGGDNGPAAAAQLNGPRSVAIDSARNLYVADAGNNRVRKITASGTISSVLTQLNDPEQLAVDGSGSLYVADTGNNRVLKLPAFGPAVTLTQVLKPVAVAADSVGNVFVSQLNQIVKVSTTGTLSIALDGLNNAHGLAVTAEGDLLVAETGVNVIRKLSSTGGLATLAGTGVAGFSGDGGPATLAQFNTPTGLAVDPAGTIYVADSANNRIRAMTGTVAAEQVAGLTIVNAATLAPGPVSPGEIVTVFGTGFDPDQTQLLFGGQPATLFYTGISQINALAPAGLTPGSTVEVSVVSKGARLASIAIPVVSSVPGLFTLGNGTGQAAAHNEEGSINSVSNPAPRGSIITLYATGEGTGASSADLKVAGYTAEILYAGPSPGFSGLMQINARVPAGFAPSGILPVILSIGDASTQEGVTIAVR